VLVQVTWMVEVWSVLLASTPTVPKLRVAALFTVQVAVMVICTVIVVVEVAALSAFPEAIRRQAASAAAQPRNLVPDPMTLPERNSLSATTLRNLLIRD